MQRTRISVGDLVNFIIKGVIHESLENLCYRMDALAKPAPSVQLPSAPVDVLLLCVLVHSHLLPPPIALCVVCRYCLMIFDWL